MYSRTARKEEKRKKKKKLHFFRSICQRSLQELAAQEELVQFYKSFWCSSHHLYHEEE